MQTVTDYDSEIYADLRQYLLNLLGVPVVRGRQNNAPLPDNAVIMQLLYDQSPNQDYDENGNICEVVTRVIQLDFFGEGANNRARKIATFWKTDYTCDALKKCQPLYTGNLRSIQFINEKNLFEDRAILEVFLQFSVVYEYNVETTSNVKIGIHEWRN